MRRFQESTQKNLEELARRYGTSLAFESVSVEPSAAIGHRPSDVYLRTTLTNEARSLELFIYTNEAEANVGSSHLSFELADFGHDQDRLEQAFIRFLDCVLGGC